jgi:UDP-glucose 4-epimerase
VGKLSFEHYLHCYGVVHGLSYAALRYANVYGPRQNPHGEAGVVAIFCIRLLNGQDAIINGDGLQTRDYAYVDDVVRAVLAALDRPVAGHFNVGTGRQATVNELFRLIVGHLGVDAEERHGPPRPGEQRTSALDCTLIGQKLGWRPQVRLEDGLARTAAWFRDSVALRT